LSIWVKTVILPFFLIKSTHIGGRSTNPVGGFVQAVFRETETPETLKKFTDQLFVKPTGIVRKPFYKESFDLSIKKNGRMTGVKNNSPKLTLATPRRRALWNPAKAFD